MKKNRLLQVITLFFVGLFSLLLLDSLMLGKVHSQMSHNTMVLVGTLRDFKDTHPDFERTPGVAGFDYGLDHEITTDTIG